ncbi:MAG TPA: RNA polymerase sigma factor [Isosphaeraceae bacterium]|jgi:RNA polymerase sigma factor (sigma-70 family)|nr:RNA polymerase sigma factor [Isosphaeraceae bacterium]
MASGHHGAVLHYLHRLFSAGSVAGMGETQLLERFIARRDEAAFEALVARHGPMVLAVCRKVLRDEHDVEDAFQATFLVLVRRAGSIQRRELLANWLFGVAHRVAVRARTQSGKRRAMEKNQLKTEFAARPAREADLDEGPILLDEVSRLPAHHREVVVLCHLEGLSIEEAAQQLNCPAGTIKSRLARARDRLHNRLTRRGLAVSVGALSALLPKPASASVPTTLINATVKAAARVATGQVTAGAVSATVIQLTEGVVKTMFLNKLKLAGAAALAVGFAVTGAGVLAYQDGPGPDQRQPGNLNVVAQDFGKASTRPDEPRKLDNDEEALLAALRQDAAQEAELLKVQLQAKEAELAAAERRLEHKHKVFEMRKQLVKTKAISEMIFLDSENDVLDQELMRDTKKFEVLEVKTRLQQALQRVKNPQWLTSQYGRSPNGAPSADWERRLRAVEQKIEQFSQDIAELKSKVKE